MKSPFYQYIALLLCSTAGAYGLSLYDTAPAIGLPESHAATYSANWHFGYDSNPNTSYGNYGNRGKKGSAYTGAGLSTSFSDIESVDRITYSARLGANYYFNSNQQSGANAGQKWSADCGLTANMSHSFSAQSQNTTSVSLTFRPEPEYDDAYSNQGRQGDCFTWNINDSYSQAIDSRWSWHVGGNYSGTKYTSGSSTGWNDNRQYGSGNAGISYRESDRTSYTLDFNGRQESRTYGVNTQSYTSTIGVNHSLTPVSSMNLSVGIQAKVFKSDIQCSPVLSAGYNRRVTEGLNISSYAHFSNENTDSYRGYSSSYKNVYTWRIGVNCNYILTPVVSYNFGTSLYSSQYSGGQNGMAKEDRITYDFTAGMSYKFTEKLSGNINATFGRSNYNRANGKYSYNRVNTSCGLSYSF